MAQEPNTEQRLASLEKEVAELKLQHSIQETRDYALLARIDSFIETQNRTERSQLRGFEQVFAAQKQQSNRLDGVETRLDNLETGQKTLEAGQQNLERAMIEVVDTLKNHKTSIETLAGQINELAAGQQQILSLLIGGKSPRND